MSLKAYYTALKPERTYANVMTAAAGFLFASRWHSHWALLLATLGGTTLVVMSACGINNCTDRKLDSQMSRTKRRPTVTGQVPVWRLAILSAILGFMGFVILALFVNWSVVLLGAVGYVDYVVLYGWSKRTTPWSTLIGTISGAVPLMAGYVAVGGQFNLTALLLGVVMVCWQMPHFYAIGVFRLKDYMAGNLPIWPVRYGVRNTQVWMLLYISLYVVSIGLLGIFGNAGYLFTVVMGLFGLYWLWLGIKGLKLEKPEKWARGLFGFSLVNLLVFSVVLAVAHWIG